MRKRILNILLVLMAIAGSASAQQLSVGYIDVQPGDKTEMVVSIAGATDITALQFNLSLPQGFALTEQGFGNGVTLGTAADDHNVSVVPLNSGDMMFIVYSMKLGTFIDGELLRIPITVASDALFDYYVGRLYTVRMATTAAVSRLAENVLFSASVTPPAIPGDANGDREVNITDVTYVLDKINGNPSADFVEVAADLNSDGEINITDITLILDIINSAQ